MTSCHKQLSKALAQLLHTCLAAASCGCSQTLHVADTPTPLNCAASTYQPCLTSPLLTKKLFSHDKPCIEIQICIHTWLA